MRTQLKWSGFTLIELLIVVAIIAILAAIAVPNFLEAQVRAKVSRSKTDQRNASIAFETYAVDYGKPPLGCYTLTPQCRDVAGATNVPCVTKTVPAGMGNLAAWSRLTTPLAYITSIPQDPFRATGDINQRKGTNSQNRLYVYDDYAPTAKAFGLAYGNVGYYRCYTEYGYIWSVYGAGPSRNSAGWICNVLLNDSPLNVGTGFYTERVYDPSNGTISQGWVVRTNKGIFAGQPGS